MKKNILKFCAGILVLGVLGLYVFSPAQAETIIADGEVNDWLGVPALGTDADDINNDTVDIKAAYADNDNDNLYLRLDVYGVINRSGNTYFVYLDSDQNVSTGFNCGWWNIGADYRIYIDEWNMGLQKFMGVNEADDKWGWEGTLYNLKEITTAYKDGTIEYAVLKSDLEEETSKAINILFRCCPGDDALPYYNEAALMYTYSLAGDGGLGAEEVIDNFEYPTSEELNSIYSAECDDGASLTAASDSAVVEEGTYSAKMTYSLGNLWSSVKLVRYFSSFQDWSSDKSVNFWVKGYSGCTENLLVYIVEEDGDEWCYQNSAILVNEAWTKAIVPLSNLWDNPWDGGLGDGVKTLTQVMGYKIVIQDANDDGCAPLNKSIYIDDLAIDTGKLSAAHAIPDIKTYTCYYGWGREADLSKFDLVIIEAKNYTPQQIMQIKSNTAVVLGYISLGEDVRQLQTEDGKGPIAGGILMYNNYASYYLDDNPKDGYPDQNVVWGGYYINAGNTLWQDYVINTTAKEVIVDKGCDGLFLDTIGIVEEPAYSWTSPGMISLVAALRKAYPDKFLVSNRAFEIFDAISPYVNAEMFESFTSTYDWYAGDYTLWGQEDLVYTAGKADEINVVRGFPGINTVNVLSLDYCDTNDVNLYMNDYARAGDFGFIPAVSDIYLSKIYMVNPANNFNAAVIKIRKRNTVTLRWEADIDYIYDSNVSHFIIKRAVVPILTDEDWVKAEILSNTVPAYAVSFSDKYPPKGKVYYAIAAIKEDGMELTGRLTASCIVE